MFLFFRGISEAKKKYPLSDYKDGDDARKFGSNIWIGYTIKNYPLFMVEIFLESLLLFPFLFLFCKG